ncbi:MAG: TlpA disulfide reductase family protein [Phaeodactylibacter sp.]|uniref:TlpA disulfide reductase family protein n=1 Tax=Phaeodactylibacter sp. TaxID=1940289 RepID=UPI0032EB543A
MSNASRLVSFFVVTFMLLQQTGCIVVENEFSALPPGPWRGVLELEPNLVTPNPDGEPLPEKLNLEFEEVTNGELPFNFEVIYTNENDFYIELINGEERLRVDDITIGLDRATAKDTIVINFPVYDSRIEAIYEEDVMEGEWIVNNRGERYRIPFKGYHGKGHRFTTLRKEPDMDLTGKWSATFGVGEEEEDRYPAVAEFKQTGNALTGTFLTETGDYRFLQGSVQADKVYLSCFDGAHAFMFEARIREDGSLLGSFRSGKHFQTLWTAKKDPDATLPDPDSLTSLKEGYSTLEFAFPTPGGDILRFPDAKYDGKVVIIQLLGTWCPNCRDESEFLKAYLNDHPDADLEVIGLAFERYRETDKAMAAISRFEQNVKPGYEIALAGYADNEEAVKALPMLSEVIAYPTMIILGKTGEVERIHTGFNGPATSAYADFKKDFNTFIARLLE